MQIFNGRPTFFGAYGARLVDGRLLVYQAGTTTYANIWSDPGYSVPLANPIQLGSAGWWEVQPYAAESVDIIVQEFIGLDEFAAPIYNDVTTFSLIADASIAPVSDGDLVDTIADLRALAPVDGAVIGVKGYYAPEDSFLRFYRFESSSAAIDDGGAIIMSSTTPVGRWLLCIGQDALDIRAYGVIPGYQYVNSQLRAAQEWASSTHHVLHIPAGTYKLVAGGSFDSYAVLDVAEGANFTCGTVESGSSADWYTWNLYNSGCKIRTTLAGVNVRLTISGNAWENTDVPISAFNNVYARGYSHGTGNPNLVMNVSTGFTFDNNCSINRIKLVNGYQANIYMGAATVVNVDSVEGVGTLAFMQTNTFTFAQLRASLVGARLSYAMTRTTDLITLDTPVTLHSGAIVTAYVEACGLGSLNTADNTAAMTGGYGGKPNFILSTHGLNGGANTILQTYFAAPNGLVNTWNLSVNATGDLDMGGSVATAIVSRNGKVVNGTIGGASCSHIGLDRVTVTGNMTSSYVVALDSTLAGMPNVISSTLTNCVITGTNTIRMDRGSKWINVNAATTGINCIAGNAYLANVYLGGVLCSPDPTLHTFSNFHWIGGSASYLNFDASLMTSDADAIATNVKLNIVVNTNLNSVNGSTRRWAIYGHKNIDIRTNKLSTHGMCLGTFTKLGGTTNGFGYVTAPVFVFRTEDTTASAYTCHVDGFSATDSYMTPGPVGVWAGASVLNTPRALRCGYYGQSGSNPANGQRINVSWNAYPSV